MDVSTDLPQAVSWEDWLLGNKRQPLGPAPTPTAQSQMGVNALLGGGLQPTPPPAPQPAPDPEAPSFPGSTGSQTPIGPNTSAVLSTLKRLYNSGETPPPALQFDPSDLTGQPSAPSAPQAAPQAAPAAPAPPPVDGPRLLSPTAYAASQAAAGQPPSPPPAAPVVAPSVAPGEAPAGGRNYADLIAPIYGAESGGKGDAKNPFSSASGQGQFLNDTWKAFLASPANTGGWTMADKDNDAANRAAIPWYAAQNDGVFQAKFGRPATNQELLASHFFGGAGAAALVANPDAPAYDTLKAIEPNVVDQVFANNGKLLNKSMTGSQAMASAIGHFTGAAPAANGPMIASTTAESMGGGDQGQFDIRRFLPGGQLPFSVDQTQLPRGQALLSMAAGLLSGHSLSEGLGKGLQNLTTTQLADIANKRAANSQALQLAQIGMLGSYRGAQVGLGQIRANTGVVNSGIHAQAVNNTNLNAQQRNLIAAGNEQAHEQSVANQGNPDLKGQIAGSTEMGKQAAEDQRKLLMTRQSDIQSLQDDQTALDLVARNPTMMGTTLAARLNRTLATAGITTGADDLSAVQKSLSANRNNYLNTVTGGHMSMLRAFAADKFFSQATADLTTNPQAAAWIIRMQQTMTQAQMAWRDAYEQLDNANPAAVSGKNYYKSQDQFFADYAKTHPLPQYVSSATGATPTASQQAGGSQPPIASFWR